MRSDAGLRFRTLYARGLRCFRVRRMRAFARWLGESRARPLRVLDVGGTRFNWDLESAPAPARAAVVLLNPNARPEWRRDGIAAVRARAEQLPFRDQAFDAVFSNSLLEHIRKGAPRAAAAAEMRRVGRALFVQTPARSFPVEPHWLGIGVHWLPRRMARTALRWLTVWGAAARPSRAEVERQLDATSLLGAAELRRLFPDAELRRERWLGLTKSYLVCRRAPAARTARSRAIHRAGEPRAGMAAGARSLAAEVHALGLRATRRRETRRCRQLALRAGLARDCDRLYFHHIRKTGGTSLVQTLLSIGGEDGAAVYRRMARSRSGRAISGERVFVGWRRTWLEAGDYHVGFSHEPAHALRLPARTFLVSCLREPSERVLSHYWMLVAAAQAPSVPRSLAPELRWLGRDFDDFLDRLPREHLLRQLYTFSERFEVAEAFDWISALDCLCFTDAMEAGVERLSQRLGLALAPRHARRRARGATAADEPGAAALARLREELAPEYELWHAIRAAQAPALEADAKPERAAAAGVA